MNSKPYVTLGNTERQNRLWEQITGCYLVRHRNKKLPLLGLRKKSGAGCLVWLMIESNGLDLGY